MRELFIAAAVTLASCAPPLTEDKAILSVIAGEAAVALSRNDLEGDLSSAMWPKMDGIERAYFRPEGLYLRMSGAFVSERGYFVPRHPAEFVSDKDGDPSYELLGSGVYAYEIKG